MCKKADHVKPGLTWTNMLQSQEYPTGRGDKDEADMQQRTKMREPPKRVEREMSIPIFGVHGCRPEEDLASLLPRNSVRPP